MPDREQEQRKRALMQTIAAQHPGFKAAVVADARVTAGLRGEKVGSASRVETLKLVLRLCWVSDAFLAQVLYRLKAALQAKGVPVLPRLAHRLSMMLAQISIGDPVVIEPGIYIFHGQVVIDGLVRIGRGAAIGPWTTIGLLAGNIEGPTIDRNVQIGTGAKIIGPVRIGAGAKIGANAVVTSDVAPAATVSGVPAKPHGR